MMTWQADDPIGAKRAMQLLRILQREVRARERKPAWCSSPRNRQEATNDMAGAVALGFVTVADVARELKTNAAAVQAAADAYGKRQ